jgi:hypothetical protein
MFQTSLQRVDDGRLQQTTGICEDIHLHPVYRLVMVKIEFTIRQIYDASQRLDRGRTTTAENSVNNPDLSPAGLRANSCGLPVKNNKRRIINRLYRPAWRLVTASRRCNGCYPAACTCRFQLPRMQHHRERHHADIPAPQAGELVQIPRAPTGRTPCRQQQEG